MAYANENTFAPSGSRGIFEACASAIRRAGTLLSMARWARGRSSEVLAIEDMPDWLLHDLGLTRAGLRIGPGGRPLRDVYGRERSWLP